MRNCIWSSFKSQGNPRLAAFSDRAGAKRHHIYTPPSPEGGRYPLASRPAPLPLNIVIFFKPFGRAPTPAAFSRTSYEPSFKGPIKPFYSQAGGA